MSPPIIKMRFSENRQFTRKYTYLNALSILINLVSHLEVTAPKLFCDKLFFTSTAKGAPPEDGAKLPDPSTFGRAGDVSWGFVRLLPGEDYVQDMYNNNLGHLVIQIRPTRWRRGTSRLF